MSAGKDPAYPVDSADYRLNGWRGLTKRELFAAMAMQGMAANPDEIYARASAENVAISSIEMADALIAALEGK